MTLHVGLIEAIYITVTVTALALKTYAMSEAYRDYRVVRALNGKAREIAAFGDLRRELVRIVVTLLLLSIAIPGIFVDRDVPLTPVVAALMAIPLILLANTFYDLRERRRLITLIARETGS